MESYYSKPDLEVDLTLCFFSIWSFINKKKKISVVILNYAFSYLQTGTVVKIEAYVS